ncbi:MAG TPA: hypothetical protein VMB25_01425, partial [Bryobacteraceae bacterium]|nr:hypothetical protein [Bryobacteraceae bacterium]
FLWLEPRVKFTLNGPFVTEFPKVGVPVLSYDSFALPGKEFQMYALKVDRIQRSILRHGGSLTIEKPAGYGVLMLAHLK